MTAPLQLAFKCDADGADIFLNILFKFERIWVNRQENCDILYRMGLSGMENDKRLWGKGSLGIDGANLV